MNGRSQGGASGVALVTLGNLSSPVMALVTAPLLARGLGVEGRGAMAAAVAPLTLLAAALTFGLPESLTFGVARRAVNRRTIWEALGILAAGGAVASIVVGYAADPLSGNRPELANLIGMVAWCAVPALVVAGVRGTARGYGLWGRIALEQVVSSIWRLVGVLVLMASSYLTIASAAMLFASGTFIGGLAYVGTGVLRASPIAIRSELVGRSIAPMGLFALLKYGVAVWIGAVAGIALSRVDQTIVLPLSNATALGIYAVAASLADVVRVFNSAVRDVVFAEQSASFDLSALAAASRVSTLVTTLGSGLIIALGFLVIPLLFGQEYSEVPAVMSIIIVGTVLGNPGSIVAAGISARGRPIVRSLAILAGVVLNVVLLFAMVPRFGAYGAAWAAAVANAFTGWIVLGLAKVTLDINPVEMVRIGKADRYETMRVARRLILRRLR